MRSLEGFSLVELSIGLLVIGVIIGSVFKGMQLVEKAKTQAVIKQFQDLRSSLEQYMFQYGGVPKVASYSGSGLIAQKDTPAVFKELYEKGFVGSPSAYESKAGGVFQIDGTRDESTKVVVYSLELKDTLNSKQAKIVKDTLNGNKNDFAKDGDVEISGCGISGEHLPAKVNKGCKVTYRFGS